MSEITLKNESVIEIGRAVGTQVATISGGGKALSGGGAVAQPMNPFESMMVVLEDIRDGIRLIADKFSDSVSIQKDMIADQNAAADLSQAGGGEDVGGFDDGGGTKVGFLEKGKETKEIWFYEHKLPDGYKAYSKTKPIRYEEFDPLKEWWNNRKENKFAWKINIREIESNYYDLDYKNPTQPKPEKIYTAEELTKQIYDSLMESQEIIKKISKDIEND